MSFPKRIPSEVLYIAYEGGDTWVLPIWSKFNEAVKTGRISDLTETERDRLGNLSLSTSRKLDFIPIVLGRLNRGAEHFKVILDERNRAEDDYVFSLDEKLRDEILVDFDGLLFELTSCTELFEKFCKGLLEHVTQKQVDIKSYLIQAMKRAGLRLDWYSKLDSVRNHFIHEAAPTSR